MPEFMQAAVLSSAGQLDIISRPLSDCGRFDVQVAVEICGVCRTDRKAFVMGQRDLQLPRVLGHEIVGRIQAVGSEVQDYAVGQRVQVFPGVICGSCAYCQSGLDHLCAQMQIVGFHLDGGFAEVVQLPGREGRPPLLNLIPDTLDARTASLTEPLACSLNMLQRLDIAQAQTVLIFGAGPLGILSAQLVRQLGAPQPPQIIIVEVLEKRRQMAARFSDFQLAYDDQTAAQILEISDGRGADVVIPCASGSAPFRLGLEVAAKRGRVGFFSGLTDSGELTSAALNAIHYRELSLIGSYGCSAANNREALALLASGQVSRADIAALEISWPQLPEVLAALEPAESEALSEHVFTFFDPHK